MSDRHSPIETRCEPPRRLAPLSRGKLLPCTVSAACLPPRRAELSQRPLHFLFIQRDNFLSSSVNPLGDPYYFGKRHEVERALVLRFMVPILDRQPLAIGGTTHDVKCLFEPLGSDEPHLRARLIYQGVGGDSASVGEKAGLRE